MNKLIAGLTVLLMLAGCSEQNAGNSSGTQSEQSVPPSQTATVETADPTDPTDPTDFTDPTAAASQAPAVLEPGRLRANFGFADAEGKHILVTREDAGEEKEMALLTKAIGDAGKVLSVRFEKWPGRQRE